MSSVVPSTDPIIDTSIHYEFVLCLYKAKNESPKATVIPKCNPELETSATRNSGKSRADSSKAEEIHFYVSFTAKKLFRGEGRELTLKRVTPLCLAEHPAGCKVLWSYSAS